MSVSFGGFSFHLGAAEERPKPFVWEPTVRAGDARCHYPCRSQP